MLYIEIITYTYNIAHSFFLLNISEPITRILAFLVTRDLICDPIQFLKDTLTPDTLI